MLSGGGIRGAFQAGVIDTLARRGVRPDLLVGTSVGALNATYWALHPDIEDGDGLRRLWSECDRRVMQPDRLSFLGVMMGHRRHLVARTRLERFLRTALGDAQLMEDASTPLMVVAADLLRGERVILRQGPLLPALLASTAVPGVFEPVSLDGRLLIDGGVVANCPVDAAVEAGASDVIAVGLLGDTEACLPTGMLDVVGRSVMIALRRQLDLTMAATTGDARIALLRCVLKDEPVLGRSGDSDQLFALGREAAERFLTAHLAMGRRVVPGLLRFEGSSLATSRPREPGTTMSETEGAVST